MITLPPLAGSVWPVAPTPIVLRVDTAHPVDPTSWNITLDTQFRFTLNSDVDTYDFRVDWGEGSVDIVTSFVAGGIPTVVPYISVPGASTSVGIIDVVNNSGSLMYRLPYLLHTYPASGVYDIELRPRTSLGFPAFSFEDPAGTGGSTNPIARKRTDAYKVQDIRQWGSNAWRDMAGVFEGCDNMQLTATDTSNTRMQYVTSWDRAFTNCEVLTDFPFVNMRAATDVTSMFNGCSALQSVDAGLDWSNVTKVTYTFVGCYALTTMPALDFGSVNLNMLQTWAVCYSLTSFPLIDVHSCPQFQSTWEDCTGLTSFPPLSFDSATSLSNTWNGCSGLLSFPAINVPLVTSFSGTWDNCYSMASFGCTVFPSATSVSNAWNDCRALTTIAISLPLVTNLTSAFQGCWALNVNPIVGPLPFATNMTSMFNGCISLDADLSGLDVSNVATFTSMFQGCVALNRNLGAWDVRKATTLASMFSGCTSFDNEGSDDINNWQLGSVTSLSSTFLNCAAFNRDLSNWNIESVATLSSVLSGCTSFKQTLEAWYPRSSTSSGTYATDMNVGGSPVNRVSQPQSFDNAAWTKNAATVVANTHTSPIGTTTADKLRPSVTLSTDHSVSQDVPVTLGASKTIRCAFRAIDYTFGELVLSDALTANLYVDLSTGAVVGGSGTVTAVCTAYSTVWYVLEISGVMATANLNVKLKAWNNGTGAAFSGNASNGISIWQASVFDNAVGSLDNYSRTLKGWVGWTGGVSGGPTRMALTACGLPGGSGYTVGDILTLAGGTLAFGVGAQIRVDAIDGAGSPTGVTIRRRSGNYDVAPSDGDAWVGGTGTAAVLAASVWATKFSGLAASRTPSFGTAKYSIADVDAINAMRLLVTSTGGGGKGWTVTDGGAL